RHAACVLGRRQVGRLALLQNRLSHGYDLLSVGDSVGHWAALTAILRGLAASAFGSVSFRTPWSNRASTLSALTRIGSVTARVKVPKPRSWRCQTALATSGAGRSPWMVSWLPSTTETSSLSAGTPGRSVST